MQRNLQYGLIHQNGPHGRGSAPRPRQIQFNPDPVPLPHVENLKSKISQITDSLNVLASTIDGGGMPGMTSWPDILAKYNNLLAQTHSLSESLSGKHIPAPPRKPGEPPRPRVNQFEMIALHPLISLNELQTNMTVNLLRTQPIPEVMSKADESIARFAEKRKDGADDFDVIKEMQQIREGHDAKVDRALKSVMELKDKYDWKMRMAFDEPEDENMAGEQELENGENTAQEDVIAPELPDNTGVSTEDATDAEIEEIPPPENGGHDDIFSDPDDDDDEYEDVMDDD